MGNVTRHLAFFVLIGISTILVGAAAPSGCSGGSEAVKTGVRDVVDCTTGAVTTLVTTKLSDVEQAFKDSTDDHGSIDWGTVESKLVTILFGVAKDDAMCVVAEAVKSLVQRSSSAATATQLHPSYESVAIGFDKYRAAHDPGKTFHTSKGDQ